MRRGIDTTDSSSFGHRRARAMRPVTTYRLLIALAMIGALTGCGGSTNGDESSKVNGSIHVAAGLMQMIKGIPRIVIGPGATVQGDLHFERTVQLFVSDKATIGPVSGATPVPFTGDSPPN